MMSTKKNEEATREIINVLADKNYTVAEAREVLRYASIILGEHATVQKREDVLFDYTNPFGTRKNDIKE